VQQKIGRKLQKDVISYQVLKRCTNNMSKYKHLDEKDRQVISRMLQADKTLREISLAIGVHYSTISREVKRNSSVIKGGKSVRYKPKLAQEFSDRRKKVKPKYTKLTNKMKRTIERYIRQSYSPDVIAGRLRLEGEEWVSHETIYQYIYKQANYLYTYLVRSHRKRLRRNGKYSNRGQIANRVFIEERPTIVEERSRFGDYEVDLMIGKNHQGALVVLSERKSRKIFIELCRSKEAKLVSEAIRKLLKKVEVRTITSDNGKEFTMHESLAEKINCDWYFANPYHSWEKGSVENGIKCIRKYLPKGTDLTQISNNYVKIIEDKLNNTPRKILGYKTPNEVFFNNFTFVALVA